MMPLLIVPDCAYVLHFSLFNCRSGHLRQFGKRTGFNFGGYTVRLAYAVTTALVAGASVATLALQSPVTAQTQPVSYPASAPRPGAPASFADLVERLQPSVVNISTKQKVQVASSGNPFAGTPFEDMFGGAAGGGNGGKPITREAQSLGSGFIISADGYIVTNNHVVAANAEAGGKATVSSITVMMPDRTEYVAKLVGRDPTSDLAVLKVDGHNLPYVRFADSSKSRVGDWVIAIGEPLGLRGTVTAGIISAMHRSITGGPTDNFIQTDAAINQGNSGGPLFNMNGEVIGINSIIQTPNGGSVGLGFAIPSDTARPIVEKLRGGGAIQRGYLGVQVRPLDDGIAESLGLSKNQGELVASVVPGGAAARAGIKQGDVITKVNGVAVTPDSTLSSIVANATVGARVPIELMRNGEKTTVIVMLAERPAEDKLALIGRNGTPGLPDDDGSKNAPGASKALAGSGLTLQALTPEVAQQLGVGESVKGCVIASVDPESDAGIKGLQRGDIIVSINQQAVTSPAQANAAAAAAKARGRNSVLLLVQRGNNQPQFVAVKLVSDK